MINWPSGFYKISMFCLVGSYLLNYFYLFVHLVIHLYIINNDRMRTYFLCLVMSTSIFA
jgi:hypothetical protein